ncbi:hypothetical protein AKJ58_00070 [candidate division MSBL1 archaeon SCGC-AAA385D11]|uniref:Zinc-hook domain-containing protein n=1 Tax=candidate division MSBL1 archaeon SCGC-AAA385D11 TaxID=1698286 RepID=A0A133VPN6_9EURY|nr:hypothetical protein AKJ58_00070 [candidate division MSBL1 archaeon SCGC-AAA385D11]
MKNWKSHKNTKFKLGEGTNVLAGAMGSGKTAVLEAISYALYGTLPSIKNRTIRLDDLIRNRPQEEDSAEVEVGFYSPDGKEYTARRVIKRDEGTVLSELRTGNGELIEKPASTRVTEHISSILRLDYDLFERMIYAEQNRLDYFLTLRPGERSKRMDEILGIDKLELARGNTTTLINRLNDRIENREETLKDLKEDEEIDQLPELEEDLNELKSHLKELRKRKKELKPKLEETEKKLKKFEKLEGEINEITKKIGEKNASIRTLDQHSKQIEEKLGEDVEVEVEELKQRKSRLEKSYEKLKEDVNKLESQLSSYVSQISEQRTKKQILSERIEEISKEIDSKENFKKELKKINLPEVTKSLERLQKLLRENKDKTTSLEIQIKNLHQTLEELREAGPNCPVCERPLSAEKREQLIEEKEEQIENIQTDCYETEKKLDKVQEDISQAEELQEQGKKLKKEVEDLPKLKSKRSDIKKKFQKIVSELEDTKKACDEIKEDLKQFKKETEKMRTQYESVKNKIELRSEFDEVEKRKKEKMEEKHHLQRRLREYEKEYDKRVAKNLKRKREKLISEERGILTELSDKKELFQEKEKRIKSIQKKKINLKRQKVKVENLRGATNSLEMIRRAFSESQTSLRRHIVEAVNTIMDDLWGDIYPYNDYPRVRLAVKKGGGVSDYVLQLSDRFGNWSSVEGIASGGERTCACLTLRIAFANVLAPAMSWLVLDEPTHNLDSEGIEKLSLVLRERIPKVMNQLILITHEKRLESAVSGYLYRFSRDKSSDGPTNVEQLSVS